MYVFAGVQSESEVGTIIKKYFEQRKCLVVLKPTETIVVQIFPSLTSISTVCMCDHSTVKWNKLSQ